MLPSLCTFDTRSVDRNIYRVERQQVLPTGTTTARLIIGEEKETSPQNNSELTMDIELDFIVVCTECSKMDYLTWKGQPPFETNETTLVLRFWMCDTCVKLESDPPDMETKRKKVAANQLYFTLTGEPMNLSTGPENALYGAVYPSHLARTVYLDLDEVHAIVNGEYGKFPGFDLNDIDLSALVMQWREYQANGEMPQVPHPALDLDRAGFEEEDPKGGGQG
jgi:hypothetical protein